MAFEVIMPRMTQTMDEGKIVEWLKAEGEPVSQGEAVALVETDKASIELEAPASGRLGRIVVPAGEAATVGAPIAWILSEGEGIEGIVGVVQVPISGQETRTRPGGQPFVPRHIRKCDGEVAGPVSPVARRLAREHGIDLSRVKGTGPGGRITRDDILRAAAKKGDAAVAPLPGSLAKTAALESRAPSVPVAAEPDTRTGMRRAIADRMARSAHTAAPVTLFVEADVTEAESLRRNLQQEIEKEHGFRISLTHLVARATVRALRAHPNLNGWVVEGGNVELSKEINLGIAVAIEGGLIVPVIRDADSLGLIGIGKAVAELTERGRQRRLSEGQFVGGSFTITNLGMYGVDGFTPIINPPEIAILGVGRSAERPVVWEGRLQVGHTLFLCLTFDHRAVDGAEAAAFLQTLKSMVEKPQMLLL